MSETSSDLLTVSRSLLASGAGVDRSDAFIRRAISTAYYALFHKVAAATAGHFMGAERENSAGYVVLYRGLDHRHMKTVCLALKASTLRKNFREHLRRSAISQELRDFAETFPYLQDARHSADYDPSATFEPAEAEAYIDAAEAAIAALDRADPDERSDVLALLMVRIRD